MGILIDVILIAFVILNIIIGYKKGLISVVFSICAFLISIIVTLILFKPVSSIIINNTEIDNKIRQAIVNNTENDEQNNEEENANTLQKYIDNSIKNIENQAKEQVIESVADNVSQKAVEILTGIVLFLIVRIIVNLLKFLLENIANIPLIKQLNKIGGIAYGVVKSIIIVYLVLTILFFVVSINSNGIVANMIETSYVTKMLYTNNILVKYCLLSKNLL